MVVVKAGVVLTEHAHFLLQSAFALSAVRADNFIKTATSFNSTTIYKSYEQKLSSRRSLQRHHKSIGKVVLVLD
jgi:uncharacterized protein (DUF934 family)